MDLKDKKELTVDQMAMVEAISANIALTQKAVLTSTEAAAYLGITVSYLYKLTHRQQIPHSKPLGKMCYFDRLELEAWLMSNRVATIDELQERAQAYCAHTRTISNKKGGVR